MAKNLAEQANPTASLSEYLTGESVPELGFKRSGTDYSIYCKRVRRTAPSKRTGDGTPFADHDVLIIASYVDDLILVCTSRTMLDAFKSRISREPYSLATARLAGAHAPVRSEVPGTSRRAE